MAAISVIVVTYNQEETIGRTLDSILCQEVSVPFEIVIGDDASTDGTSAICREYAARYPDIVRYHRRERNLGLVDNYFQCLKDCQGEFIADCAGDDFWIRKDKLQMQYDVISRDPDVALVHTAWRTNCSSVESDLRSNNCKGIYEPIIYIPGTLPIRLLNRDRDCFIHLCTSLYRKSMISSEIHRNPDLFYSPDNTCEDLQIVVALSSVGKIVYLPIETLEYTIHEASLSNTRDFEKLFRQEKGYFVLTQKLLKVYGEGEHLSSEYYISKMDYLAAQVYYSGKLNLREEYLDIKQYLPRGTILSFRTRLREFLFLNKNIWRLSKRIIRPRN